MLDDSRDSGEIVGFPKPTVRNNYTCVRCGYNYFTTHEDREPYLCYVCMRFIAKRTWTTIHTIRPPIQHLPIPEV